MNAVTASSVFALMIGAVSPLAALALAMDVKAADQFEAQVQLPGAAAQAGLLEVSSLQLQHGRALRRTFRITDESTEQNGQLLLNGRRTNVAKANRVIIFGNRINLPPGLNDVGNDGNEGDEGDEGTEGDEGDEGEEGDEGDEGGVLIRRFAARGFGVAAAKAPPARFSPAFPPAFPTAFPRPAFPTLTRLAPPSFTVDGDEGDEGNEGNEGDEGDEGNEGNEGDEGNEGGVGDDGNEGNEGDEGNEGNEGNEGRDRRVRVFRFRTR